MVYLTRMLSISNLSKNHYILNIINYLLFYIKNEENHDNKGSHSHIP